MAVSKTWFINLTLCSKVSSALQVIPVGSKLHTNVIIYIYLICMKKGHVSRVYTVRAQCIAQKHTATRLVQYVQIQTVHPTLSAFIIISLSCHPCHVYMLIQLVLEKVLSCCLGEVGLPTGQVTFHSHLRKREGVRQRVYQQNH